MGIKKTNYLHERVNCFKELYDTLNFVDQMYIEKDSKYMLKNNEYCKNKLVNLCLIQFCGKGL